MQYLYYSRRVKYLAADSVSKSYGGRTVVSEVDVGLYAGEVIGLLGPNGAGKTTTFYMMVGLVATDSGKILLSGKDITTVPMYQRARLGIGYLPQEPSVFRKLSVKENLLAILETMEFESKADMEARALELLTELGIEKLADNRAGSLSGGERRRCEIARSLARSPDFILLDEPFAGIDPKAIQDIQAIIYHLKRKGIGVLITDHNVRETLGICDRAYILIDGKVLLEGKPNEIASNPDAIKYYLGDNFSL